MNPQELLVYFSDRSNCRDFILGIKHVSGFRCLRCGGTHYHELVHRGGSWQCAACGYQESARHNTIMARSKIPVEHWLRAIVAMIVSTSKMSIKELQWAANIDTYGATRMIQLRAKPVLDKLVAEGQIRDPRDLVKAVIATTLDGLDAGQPSMASGEPSSAPISKVAISSAG